MAITASWGSKYFSVTPGKVVPFDNLTTSFALKTETNSDTSGTLSTNTRGRELQKISFDTAYLAAAGTDPRSETDIWNSLLGAVYPLYIAGKQFGANNMQLTKVDVSEVRLSPSGVFLSVKLSIAMTEYQPQTVAINTKATTSDTTDSTALQTTTGTTLNKVAALNAKASSEDKQAITGSGTTSGTTHGGGGGTW